jgi:hypothetical protein
MDLTGGRHIQHEALAEADLVERGNVQLEQYDLSRCRT